MRFSELPRRLQLYILSHLVLLAPLLYMVQGWVPVKDWQLVGGLLAFTVIFSTWKVELSVLQGKMTATFAVVCLALLLQGQQAAALCAISGAIVGSLVVTPDGSWRVQFVRWPFYKVFFNVANCAIACALAAAAYDTVFGFAPD